MQDKTQIRPDVNNFLLDSGKIDWDKWLNAIESNLKVHGFSKFHNSIGNEDYSYWKTITENDTKIYQIGVLFYDFRPFVWRDPSADRISISYQCHLLGNDRIDLTVCKDIDVLEFSKMADVFYKGFKDFM